MLHELFVRIAGVHITSLIYFLLLNINYNDDQLVISMQLKDPATKETISIVQSGFIFQIKLYGSVIVNKQRVHRFEQIKTLAMKDSVWHVNETAVPADSFQLRLGECNAVFDKIQLKEGDRLLLYFSASILPDQDFEISTGLTTAILWNYYIPHIKLHGVVQNGKVEFEE